MALVKKTFEDIFTFSRASTATYFDKNGVLQTAAAGEVRFDHDPVTGEALGVLIEESRTNELTYSEAFDNAAWVESDSTLSSELFASPAGTASAYKLMEASTTSPHGLYTNESITELTTYTLSVYLKAAERHAGRLRLGTDVGFINNVEFDVQAGSATGPGGIESVGGGWYRLWGTFDAQAGATVSTQTGVFIYLSGATSYTGDGTSGIYIWGAQLEEGTSPTSYIPTSGSIVTRSADSLQHTIGSEYNSTEGTWVIKSDSVDGTVIDNVGFKTAKVTGDGTVIYTYNQNGGSFYANGAKEFETAVPSTPTEFYVGDSAQSQKTKQIRYYPYSFSDSDAIAAANGSVTVDWLFGSDNKSLVLGFSDQDFGTRSIVDALDTSRSSVLDDFTTFTRSSTATYFDKNGVLQTAAVDEVRYDHDPVTGEPLGVLIEESRTNRLVRSEDLSQWTKGAGVSFTSRAFGDVTEHEITANATSDGEAQVFESFYNSDNNVDNTYSVLLRKGTARYAVFTLQSGAPSYNPDLSRFFSVLVDFDQKTTVGNQNNYNATHSATFYGDFCAVDVTSSSINTGTTHFRFSIAPSDEGSSHAYRARCSGSSVFFSMGQVERDASYSTSYIPTTGSAVTRAADNLSRVLGAEFNDQEGSVYAEFSPIAYPDSTGAIFSFNDGTTNNRLIELSLTGGGSFQAFSSGVGVASTDSGQPLGVTYKSAVSTTQTNLNWAIDGIAQTSVSGDSTGIGITTLEMFGLGGSSSRHITGHLKALNYYPFTMTAQEIEALTAP